MGYTDEQLAHAGRQLAESLRNLGARLEAVESRPELERLTTEWDAGRRAAKQRGYGVQDIERLESMMLSRGVQRHQDAMRLDPNPPNGRGMVLGAVPSDEMEMLMSGDENGFLNLALSRKDD